LSVEFVFVLIGSLCPKARAELQYIIMT